MLPAGLEDPDDGLALRAWELAVRGVNRWAGGVKALSASVNRFLELLGSRDLVVRIRAWALAPKLIDIEVLSFEQLKRLRGLLAETLTSRGPSADILAEAWQAAASLAEKGVLGYGDLFEASEALWYLESRVGGKTRELLEDAERRLAARDVIRPRPFARSWRVLGEDVIIL